MRVRVRLCVCACVLFRVLSLGCVAYIWARVCRVWVVCVGKLQLHPSSSVQDDKAAATAATATAQVSGRYNRYQPLGGSFCRDHTDPNDRLTICLATTGVGISGERVLAAVQGQFPETGIHIIVLPHLTDDNLEVCHLNAFKPGGYQCLPGPYRASVGMAIRTTTRLPGPMQPKANSTPFSPGYGVFMVQRVYGRFLSGIQVQHGTTCSDASRIQGLWLTCTVCGGGCGSMFCHLHF